MSKNDWRCQTCHGEGYVYTSQAEIFKDERTFAETPREVIQAITESQVGYAFIACPTCGGTGESVTADGTKGE